MIQQVTLELNQHSTTSNIFISGIDNLIQQTSDLIKKQKQRERQSKLQNLDHFMNFFYSIEKQYVFSQFAIVSIEFKDEFRSTKRDIFNPLQKFIKENLEFSQPPKYNDESQKNQFTDCQLQEINNNIIIIELDNMEVCEIKKKNAQLKPQDFKDLVQKKSKQNLDFWQSQHKLQQIYYKEIEQQTYKIQPNELLVYVTRKRIKPEDLKSHFEQNFIIKLDDNQKEELLLDITNSGAQKTYVPLIIFNQLFEDSVINPILELSKLSKINNVYEIQKCLKCTDMKPIDVYHKLIQTANNCNEIGRWINLLTKYLVSQQLYSKDASNDAFNNAFNNAFNDASNDAFNETKNYIDQWYQCQDKRYQDEFYDVMKEDSLDKFIDNIAYIQKKEDSLLYSIVLYEIKQKELILYQLFKIGQDRFYVLSKLQFFTQKVQNDQRFSNYSSIIDQLSLVNKEERNTVYTLKFKLKEENQYLLTADKKYQGLIMEILMKCITFKAKYKMYNPATRRLVSKQSSSIEI